MTGQEPSARLVGGVLQALADLVPELSEKEARVALMLFRLLARGLPVTSSDLAVEAGMSASEVASMLDPWYGVVRDKEGRITAFWGLTLAETPHRLTVNRQDLFGWCALDALALPALLKSAASIRSTCPVTDVEIRVEVAPGGLVRVEPESAMVSLIQVGTREIRSDIVSRFCRHVRFLESSASGLRWCRENEGTFLVPVETAHAMGIQKNVLRLGEGRAGGAIPTPPRRHGW